MRPMFPSETAKPIMEYVRTLESKVRRLRMEDRLFRAGSFLAGMLVGGAGMLVFLWIRARG